MANDAERLAERCAAAMWEADAASADLGMVIEEVGPGQARLSMVVEARMLNGFGLCHNGFIFALADSAFSLASNSRNERSVVQYCAITYLRPAHGGERLVATVREVALADRSGLYDVQVVSEAGVVAEIRGQSRQTGGRVVDV